MLKILVIDDEKPTLSMFRLFLTAYGYQVLVAENGKTGLEIFDKELPQIVFTDIRMPGMDGIEVLRKIRSLPDIPYNLKTDKARSTGNEKDTIWQQSRTQVIVITGHGDMDKAIEALDLGASDFINKPVEKRALESALKRAEMRIKNSFDEPLKPTSDVAESLYINPASNQTLNPDSRYCLKNSVNIYKKNSEPTLHVDITGRLTADSYGVQQINIARTTSFFENINLLTVQFSPDFSISRNGIDWLINFMAWVRDKGIHITMSGLSYNYIRFFQMAGLHEIAQILESQCDE